MAVKGLVESGGSGLVVQPRAAFGLRYNLFDDAHRQQVSRGQLELLGGLHLARVVTPHDRRRGLRRRHRVDRVLEHDHAISDAHPKGSAASTLANHSGDDRNGNTEPLHDRLGDGRSNSSLFGPRARVCAGRVDQRDDRKVELGSMLGQAYRFAIALRVHHPPIPGHPLFEAAALLMAEEHRGPPVPGAHPAGQRGVIAGDPVAVHLHEVRRHPLYVVEGVRPVGMPGKLHHLPDGEGRLLRPAAVQLHG